jgi:hypothetical protein
MSSFLKITIAGLSLLCLAAAPAVADTTISLHDAVRQGKVRVDVKSRGGAAGPTVRVEVQRLVPESLRIEVAPGTVLVNAQNSQQNVAVGKLMGEFTTGIKYRPGSVMVLADGQAHSFLLEVYCLDYAKKAPRAGGALSLAVQDKRVARILNPPAHLKPTLGAVQIAIWMDRAGITAQQARKRFRGETTEVDVRVARELLVHAEKTGVESIPDDMPASVKVHVEKLFSSNPEIRARAAAAIGKLGAEARPAVSFLVENVLDRSTDKPLPPSVVGANVEVTQEMVRSMLAQLDIESISAVLDTIFDGSTLPSLDGSLIPSIKALGEGKKMPNAGGLVGDILIDSAIARLKSSLPAVRARTARVLGNSGNQRAVAPLVDLLEDSNERVRKAAAEALKSLTKQDFGADVARWRAWLKDQQ